MFATKGEAISQTSLTFVSQAAVAADIQAKYGLSKRIVPVSGIRNLRKSHMVHNAWQPKITVDPETYEVIADGELLTCEPAAVLPLAQRYFLF